MTLRATTSSIALGAFLLGFGGVAAAQPTQVNVGTTDQTEVEYINPMFVTGALVFGASYGAAVIAASDSSHQGDNHLYVPLVGPWIDLGTRGDCPVANIGCDHETTDKVLLVVDGVFQAAGFITFVDAVLDPARHPIGRTAERGVHFHPTTMASAGGTAPGFALSGGF